MSDEHTTDFDAVVIGAGFSGLYMLHRLRNEMGLSAACYETGGGVGGTWYWNRYPGARSDSDSYIYGFTRSTTSCCRSGSGASAIPEQHEIRAYLEHVAERYDLTKDIHVRHEGHRRDLRRGHEHLDGDDRHGRDRHRALS